VKLHVRADEPFRVALILCRDSVYFSRVSDGVKRFCREHLEMSIELRTNTLPSRKELRAVGHEGFWYGLDGAINFRHAGEWRGACCPHPTLPVVFISERQPVTGEMAVLPDQIAIGTMAARYFLAQGFKHMACCGWQEFEFSRQRLSGFRQAIPETFGPVPCLEMTTAGAAFGGPVNPYDPIREWLSRLPKSCAVFASTDALAHRVRRVCKKMGLDIPGDIALMGVDNEGGEAATEVGDTLSSVDPGAERIGYEAARMLLAAMKGEKKDREILRLPPVGIHVRASTEVWALDDPVLQRAQAYLRDHFQETIGIEQVAAAAGVSRRLLEMKFRARFGRTPREVLEDMRLRHACKLLRETTHTLEYVAELCGYGDPKAFFQRFKAVFGETPGRYRSRARGLPEPVRMGAVTL
jgi:LacI family transcriptional regulator